MNSLLFTWPLWLLLAWCLVILVIVWVFRRPLLDAWHEPVLAEPVLIIESDDWGPGPAYQCDALAALERCLSAVTDHSGHSACITLGLTLSVPDAVRLRADDGHHYHARWLDDPAFTGQLAALRAGIEHGVFDPQLHGSAHYWPPALLLAAQDDPAVRDWLLGESHETEQLPGALQSRWTDASILPSRPLDSELQRTAVHEEVDAYRRIFGRDPYVVVPPTFVWNAGVEQAWADAGVRCVITPGRRYTQRNAQGQPDTVDRVMHNAGQGAGAIRYLVRDLYFEPSLGHRAESTLDAMVRQLALGRPCLLEMHRFNFTESHRDNSLAELARLLQLSLQRFPQLRFLSSEELDQVYRNGSDMVEQGWKQRLPVMLERMLCIPRFSRLARLSGLVLPLRLLQRGLV